MNSTNRKLLIFSSLILLSFALILFLFAKGLNNDPKELPSVLTGKPLPSFELPDINQQTTHTNQDLPQKPFLLNVWGSWCIACHQEHPYLMQLAQHIDIVGLNWAADNPNEEQEAQEFLRQLGNPYHLILKDDNAKLVTDLGVYGAPETFLIAPNQQILLRYAGVLTPEVWQTQFLPLLQN